VEAVRGYYARFLEHFPDVRSLAEADEDTCLKLWEGLGYYSRARNLQKAARQIMSEYKGEMPRTSAELIRLTGIGPYTAAAIASIAFGEKIPAVDGNLLRVFARLTLYEEEIKTPAAAAAAKAYFMDRMPQDRPGDFNQALMDLGAGICIPGSAPRCGECPLQDCCRAAAMDRAGELPVMPVKKARGIEKRTILVIRDDDRILLRRRPARGLLAGLYEFPNEAGWLSEDQAVQKAREYGCEPLHIRALADAKHVFTHKEWHMHGYEIRIGSFPENSGGDTDRKTSLEAKAGKENPKAETVRETPKAESHAAVPGRCFITTICDLQEKYALPSAYTAYFHALDKV
jgi:A/G-specific adenine glycosylase